MSAIGNQYGQALYQLAAEEGLSEAILQQLNALRQSFQGDPQYIRLLSAPQLSKQERCQILDEAFSGKLQPYLLNFLKILTEKGYMRHFDSCCESYVRLYNQAQGILPVTVITAGALSEDQSVRLREKLAQITGKTVQLICEVDESCLGGIRLEYDGKCVDDTVSHRLDNISKLLKNTVI